MHVHVSALNAMIVFAYLVVMLFLVKTLTARFPDSVYSQALRFILS